MSEKKMLAYKLCAQIKRIVDKSLFSPTSLFALFADVVTLQREWHILCVQGISGFLVRSMVSRILKSVRAEFLSFFFYDCLQHPLNRYVTMPIFALALHGLKNYIGGIAPLVSAFHVNIWLCRWCQLTKKPFRPRTVAVTSSHWCFE